MGKKIIFIIGSMRRGGAERVISILSNHFAEMYKVEIITLLDDDNGYLLDRKIEIKSFLPSSKKTFIKILYWIKNLRKEFKKESKFYDITIISFIARINILVILSNMFFKNRLLISERNDPKEDGRKWYYALLTNLLYKKADKIIFQTHYAQGCFSKNIQKKSAIIQNPIERKDEYKISERKYEEIILTAGRLVDQKNHFFLIKSFQYIIAKNPQLKLFIYGDGPLLKNIESLISSLGLNNYIFVYRNDINIFEKMQKAKIFVFSSKFEGMPNALLEAMSFGIPCVTTRFNGVDEIIENNVNGIIVDGNEIKFSDAVNDLLNNIKKYDSISNNAIKSSKKYYINRVLSLWEKQLFR